MISVCIATHNGGSYIVSQLYSILSQISFQDEIIISDDGSTDDTIKKISSIKDTRIKVFQNPPYPARFVNDYATHNFEKALSYARGEYIFLADQDDVWLPEKIRLTLAALEHQDLVISDCILTDEHLNLLHSSYFNIRPFTKSIWKNVWKSSFLGCCMAFRRSVLLSALPFPRYGVAHDLWLGLTALRDFHVGVINSPTIYYRRHANTVSSHILNNTTSFGFKLIYRFFIIRAILVRLYLRWKCHC